MPGKKFLLSCFVTNFFFFYENNWFLYLFIGVGLTGFSLSDNFLFSVEVDELKKVTAVLNVNHFLLKKKKRIIFCFHESVNHFHFFPFFFSFFFSFSKWIIFMNQWIIFCFLCLIIFLFSVEVDELKKVTAVLNALYNDKVKANKPLKGKKKGAGKAKILLDKEAVSIYIHAIPIGKRMTT